MTKLDRQSAAKLQEFFEKRHNELPDFKVRVWRNRIANHPPKCLYHSTCPLIHFWLEHESVSTLTSCTFSIRAGGQCPPYVLISFLGFDFRNKIVVQDMSTEK